MAKSKAGARVKTRRTVKTARQVVEQAVSDVSFIPVMTDEERRWVQEHLRPYMANHVKTFRPTLEVVKLDRREWMVSVGFGLNRREYVGHFRLRRPFYVRLVGIAGLRDEVTPTTVVSYPYKPPKVLFEKGTAIPKEAV